MIRKELEPKAIEIEKHLNGKYGFVSKEWSRSNTFNWVFFDFDFEKPKKGWIIGSGEIELSKLINDEFKRPIIIFSTKNDRNVEILPEKFEDRVVIRISYNGFLEFFKRYGRKKALRLFLLQIKDEADERFLRTLMHQNPDRFIKMLSDSPVLFDKVVKKVEEDKSAVAVHMSADEIAKSLSSKENLERLIQLRPEISKSFAMTMFDIITKLSPKEIDPKMIEKIPELIRLFRKREDLENIISHFEKILNEKVDEREVHKFIFDNVWLLGDEYIQKDEYKKEYEDKLVKDTNTFYKIDIKLQRLDSHKDIVVVEFKRSDVKTTKGRSKMKIPTSKVTDAISQTIEYLMTTLENEGVIAKGIVVIGSEKNPEWLRGYNNFLHGIQVMTYDEILKNAKKRIQFYY